MKSSKLTHLRKRKPYGIVLALAFVLLSAGAFAQFSWSGTQTLANGDNITQNITLAGDVTINVATNATATISGTITGGNYNLTKTGGGTLILTANNNLQMAVNVDGGTLQLGNGGSTGSTGAQGVFIRKSTTPLVMNSGRLIFNKTGTYYCENISNTGSGTYGGSVTKQGSGTMLISGNYTNFTGNLVIQANAGTVIIGTNAAGGSANGSVAGNISVASGSTLRFNRSNAYTYSGMISGAGDVEHTGKSTLTFTGVHTFTGKMTVNAGTTGNMGFLRLNDGSRITSASELELTTGLSEVVFVCTSGDLAFNKPITGAGNIQKLGGSSVWITAQPTYTGHTAVTEGAVCFIASTLSTSRIYFVSSAAHTVQIEVPSGQTLEYPNLINEENGAVAGNLIKSGPGKLILSGVNTYTGTTTVHDGTLQIGNRTSGSINNTASVDLALTTSILRFEPGAIMTFPKVISGSGKVEKAGNAELRLTGVNTYTGTTTIEAGRLCIGWNPAPVINVTGNIINNGQLYLFNGSVSGIISGTGEVRKTGSSSGYTVTLTAANTYTGPTVISTGTLVLGTNGTIQSSSSVTMESAAKFDISAGNKTIKTLNSASANTEIILGTRRLTIGTNGGTDGGGSYAGKIIGTALATSTVLMKYGKATLKLSGTSNYTGYTYVYDGTVEFNRLENFGGSDTKIAMLGGSILKWTSGNTADISPKLLSISGTRTFDVNNNNVTFASAVPYGFTKAGTGKLTLTFANTSTGVININAGTLEIGGTNGAIAGNIIVASGAKLSFNRWGYTYSGVISGAGEVEVNDNVYLTGANTYTGATTVNNGNLNIGNGGLTGSIVSNVTFNGTHVALMFNRSNAYTYSGIISGAGTIFQMGTGTLVLNGANTCTGVAGIFSTGTLELGTNGTLGNNEAFMFLDAGKFKITSDKQIGGIAASNTAAEIQLGGVLTINDTSSTFTPPSSQTFAGFISGTGGITKTGDKSLTLDGVNTYTGMTNVKAGTLILGASGSLASDNITLSRNNISQSTSTYGKLDVSAGNKTLKNLNADYASNEVILGGTTLQIGTSTFTGDGGGTFRGVFSGTGGSVAKTGFATLVLSSASTAAGTLSHAAGTIEFSGSWAGNYAQAPGAMLDVTGNTTVGGSFTLAGGGTISMDLTATTPAKINVTGAFSASGSTTMDISAIAGNFTLIESASGINNLSRFSFASINGLTLTPSLGTDNSKTQLKLGITVSDNTPPTVNSGTIATDNITAESLRLGWTLATDNQTPQAQLRYFVYQSLSNNINSIANCEANGTLLNPGGILNISTYAVSGLSPNTTYYFNIVVMDAAGNKLAYGTKSQITNKATLGGTVAISGNAVFGQTLTAVTTALNSNPTIPALGTLSYQWKRGETNISGATNATYTLVQDDIAQTITVTVTAANCDGSITSPATAAVSKATQAAPPAPVVASKTHNTITLTSVAGNEYRIDGGTWQTAVLFSDLNPETGYSFEARKAETATHFASPVSPATQDTTNAAPIPDKIYEGIQPITAITRPYQSANTAAGLGLPATVNINTDQGTVSGVSVVWNTPAAGYNPTSTSTSPQAFTVSGTITLPNGVVNTQGISLTANVQVTVEGRPLVPSITSITVTPASSNVQQGTGQQFNAQVAAVDGADESVVWSISGASAATTISSAGYLSVAATETAGTVITVLATQEVLNAGESTPKVGQATVAVTAIPVTPQVNSVTVSPATATVMQGNTQQFTAQVDSEGGASTAVNWSVTGNIDANTEVNASGLLTVGENETANTITVKATSQFNTTKFDEATVNITIAPAVLQSIQQPTAITGLPHGTLKNETALGLPANVAITTNRGNNTASVAWNVVAAAYDPTSTAAQTFTVSGTVALPVDVVNTGGVSLDITINVSVDAAPLNPQVTNVSVTPQTVSVQQGQEQQFYATVTAVDGADESVEWTIAGQNSSNTTISSTGYLSIDAGESTTSITVYATSVFDNTKFGTASVTITTTPITPQVNSVSINPASASLEQGQQMSFTAIVDAVGGASTEVDWTIENANSTNTGIDASGLLSISSDESAATITVKATSQFDNTKFGTASVTVTTIPITPQVNSVSINPASVSVEQGQQMSFTAVVDAVGGASTEVDWTVENADSPNTGIDASGLLSISSDESAVTITVKATSQFDNTKFGEATVTITAVSIPQVTEVKISPNSVVLQKGGTQQFTVTVTAVNGADESVSWYVENNQSNETGIEDGLLIVATDEASEELKVKAISNFNTDVFDEVIVNISGVGIDDLILLNTAIYPNPCVTSVTVSNAEGTELRIVDMTGKIVGYQKISSDSQQISVDNLSEGTYLFQFTKDGKTKTMKIVKN